MESYLSVEFIDDDRLLGCVALTLVAPRSLVLLDTGKLVGGVPMKTLFRLPSVGGGFLKTPLVLEHGAHKPSPEESQAPFYRDPTQRIVALRLEHWVGSPIFRMGALLELLESREGSEVEWDEWKSHVVIPSFDQVQDREFPPITRVSGCRLFSVYSEGAQAEVYDYSIQGRVEYLSDQVSYEHGGLRYLSSTGARVQLPWGADDLADVHNVHDSLVFSFVSTTEPHFLWEYKVTVPFMSLRSGLTHLKTSVNLHCTSGPFD